MSRQSVPGPSPQALDAACEWFAEFRSGEVSSALRAQFDEWLKRSPENIQAYLEVSAGWAELPTQDPDRRLDVGGLIARARSSVEDNVRILKSPDAPPVQHRRAHRIRWRARPVLLATLAGLMLLGVGLTVALLRGETYRTGIGEQRTVRLADGSTLELNALSSVRVQLSKSQRRVFLTQGQALFHVAKDHTRPFIVEAGSAQIRAVGTEFDVYRKESGTTVTVIEGQVAVLPEAPAGSMAGPSPAIPASANVLVSAGEQLTVHSQEIVRSRKPDVAAATAWVQQELIFEDTPLEEVAHEFNRYNPRRLVIADQALQDLKISGVYSTADPVALVGFLKAQPQLSVTETDGEIQIRRHSSSSIAK